MKCLHAHYAWFLAGGGECGALLRGIDWDEHPHAFGDPRRFRPPYDLKFSTLRNAAGERVGAYQFSTPSSNGRAA